MQSGQFAALHILGIHAVEEEGAIQVLHKGSLQAEGGWCQCSLMQPAGLRCQSIAGSSD